MKLAAHYNKASIIISVSVLLVSGMVYYLIINHIARLQVDSDLTEEVAEVIDYVNRYQHLPKPVDFDEDVTTFAKTDVKSFPTRFFDSPYKNAKEKTDEEGRAVSALIKVNGQAYIVTIVESMENTEDLIQIISVVTLVLAAVLLCVMIITNRFILKGLWKPFYYILQQVKAFNVADPAMIDTTPSTVEEFNDLSDAMTKMSSRVTTDYQGLKSFTENASHEMMTPLAVITSKLDMLIQDEQLNHDQLVQITDIYSAASRLSRLNQSLLLLVKIDNNLLKDTEEINLKTVILDKAQQFHEMIHNKNIRLDHRLDDLKISASKYLIDVLINNLFSNAIRHNKTDGRIEIRLSGNKLCFQNTGDAGPLNREAVFERFYKGNNSEGTGLGLAIMKNICTLYNFEISYRFDHEMHGFWVMFN